MADTLVKKPKLIVGTQSQVEAEMGANDIGFATDIEFYTSKQIDELLSKAGGASLPILMTMWSDHVINDMSWLRADTFSWQSGDVYKAAYEHLASELIPGEPKIETSAGEILTRNPAGDKNGYLAWVDDSGGTLYTNGEPVIGNGLFGYNSQEGAFVSAQRSIVDLVYGLKDTIGDITISYYQADDGHKICLPDQEANVMALYEKTGAADYYILDTTNKQFKLPRKQKRKLIQAVKNTDGTWYNLYSDGWVEQGGTQQGSTSVSTSSEASLGTITLPVPMATNTYYASASGGEYCVLMKNDATQTTIKFIFGAYSATRTLFYCKWHVAGYAAESAYASAGMRLEYYYVGNFEQSAIEQTAGLNAELFNGKADVSRVEVLEGYDYVVESQMPTADNGYTWYRKYKSGWVEQGGKMYQVSSITFPVPFAAVPTLSVTDMNGDTASVSNNMISSLSTTSFSGVRIGTNKDWTGSFGHMIGYWMAFGFATQE